MGQVESYEGSPKLDALDYQRSVQMFHGLRPELLQQLEDVRRLLQILAGLDLGLDPVMDPDCTVHDTVSSLLSQYVDKVGSLSASSKGVGATGHLGLPSPSHRPQASASEPLHLGGTESLRGFHVAALDNDALPSLPPTSSITGTWPSTSGSWAAGTMSDRSSTTGTGSTASSTGIPPYSQALGGEKSRTVKRPIKRFSTAKWVSAVVRAMALTNDKSELDRLEGGLEALARAEHDWLAAKLQAVAGRTTRLPPSCVEEVTAVGLALWVEFWGTWAGRTLAQSGSTASSSMQRLALSRPGSSSGHRKLQSTVGSGKWRSSSCSSNSNSNSSSFVERERDGAGGLQRSQGIGKWRSNSMDREATSSDLEPPILDIPARNAPWKATKLPPLNVCIEAASPIQPEGASGAGEPHTGIAGDTAGIPGPARTIPPREPAGKLPLRSQGSITEGGGGFDRLAMKPEMHEEAAFFNVDLGTLGSARTSEAMAISPRSTDGTSPTATPGQANSDSEFHRPHPQADSRQSAGSGRATRASQGHFQEACQDTNQRHATAAGSSTLCDTGQGGAARTALAQQNGTVSAHHRSAESGAVVQCLEGPASAEPQAGAPDTGVDYEAQADKLRLQAEEMKAYALQRALDRESAMRADIGNRLQGTLLEEFLLESSRHRKGLEAAPPSHAEIVRLLGLAASSAQIRQVSAAVCVLRLLDGLGREWRGVGEGGDEHGRPTLTSSTLAAPTLSTPAMSPNLSGTSLGQSIATASASLSAASLDAIAASLGGAKLDSAGCTTSPAANLAAGGIGDASLGASKGAGGCGEVEGAPKEWDRFLETKECRCFVLQCLVDLIEACALTCKARSAGRMPLGEYASATPTGQVRRLRSLGEDEFELLASTFEHSGARGLGYTEGREDIHSGAGSGVGRGGMRRGGGSKEGAWGVGVGQVEGEGEGPVVPCPATLVELAEASLVWRTRHRKDVNEAQKLQVLDGVLQRPTVGPGILALAVADEAQGLRHLSTQDLWALSDGVEDLGSFEAAFRLRLRAIAGEYEDLDAVVDVVRLAYLTRGIESVPLRLKRLVDTARFALTHAPSAGARRDYAMTFSACMLEPLMEDPSYPFAFEVADNYVGLSGLFGPVEKGEEEEVQLRTKLMCAKIIMKTVVDPLLVEADCEGDGEQREEGHQGTHTFSHSCNLCTESACHIHGVNGRTDDPTHGGSHCHSHSHSHSNDQDELSEWLSRALASGKATSGLARELMGRLSDKAETDEREEKERKKRRRERALLAWARRVDYPGIEVGWLQWQAIGLLLQSLNPNHPALVTMWAKAVRGNFKAINEEGSSSDKEAVELFDWGLEGLLCTFACDPQPGNAGTGCNQGTAGAGTSTPSTQAASGADTGTGKGGKILAARDEKLTALQRGSDSTGSTLASCKGRHSSASGSWCGREAPSGSYLWVERLERAVGPRERDRVDLLLAVGGRMASAIFWKWASRKDNQKYIARLLLYTHRVVGLNDLQRARALRISERIWGWMLPNALVVREQCETDEEASEIMENAIYATWLGAAGS